MMATVVKDRLIDENGLSTVASADALRARLIEARTRRGLTQQELAALLKVNHNQVSRWEVGVNLPTYESLCTLSRVLRVPMAWLVGESHMIDSLSEEEFRLLAAWENNDIEKVLEVVLEMVHRHYQRYPKPSISRSA